MSTAVQRPTISYNPGSLTPRTLTFIDHWIQTGNGTESARIAGFPGDDNSLASAASRLLRSVKVSAEISRRLGRHIASSDEVLERLTSHARADLAEVLEPDGSFDIRSAKRRGVSGLLKKLKTKTRYEKDHNGDLTPVVEQEFEIHDSQAALRTLAQFHGLLIERTESESVNLHIYASADERVGKLAELIARAEHRQITSQSDPLHNPALDTPTE